MNASGGPTQNESALLHGWLKDVKWDKGTAQLHDVVGGYCSTPR